MTGRKKNARSNITRDKMNNNYVAAGTIEQKEEAARELNKLIDFSNGYQMAQQEMRRYMTEQSNRTDLPEKQIEVIKGASRLILRGKNIETRENNSTPLPCLDISGDFIKGYVSAISSFIRESNETLETFTGAERDVVKSYCMSVGLHLASILEDVIAPPPFF